MDKRRYCRYADSGGSEGQSWLFQAGLLLLLIQGLCSKSDHPDSAVESIQVTQGGTTLDLFRKFRARNLICHPSDDGGDVYRIALCDHPVYEFVYSIIKYCFIIIPFQRAVRRVVMPDTDYRAPGVQPAFQLAAGA